MTALADAPQAPPNAGPSPGALPPMSRLCVWALGYFLTSLLAFRLILEPDHLAAIWPASGIFIAALLRHPSRQWAAVAAVLWTVHLVSELIGGNGPGLGAIFATSVMAESVAAAWLLRRWLGEVITFHTVREIIALALVGPLFASPLMGVPAALALHAASGKDFVEVWWPWCVSDAVGVLVITPFLMTWAGSTRTALRSLTPRRSLEAGLLVAGLLVLAVMIFGRPVMVEQILWLPPYLMFPFVVWAAMRFGPRGVTAAVLLLAAIVVLKTAGGLGPFAAGDAPPVRAVLSVQTFLAVVMLSGLILAAVIFERRGSEEALRQSEDRFRNLVETTSDWVWQVDENAVYTYASPKVRDLLGREPDEILGRTPFDLMPPDEARRVLELFSSRAAARKSFANLVNTNLHRDGRRVVLETSGVPVFGLRGEFRGYRGIDRDITERTKIEEALRRSQESLLLAQQIGGVGSWEAHPGQEPLVWSDETYRIFGCDRDSFEPTNSGFYQLVHPDDREQVREAVNESIRTGGDYGIEHRIVRPDGTVRTVVEHARLLKDASGGPVAMLGTVQDISALKDAGEEIRRLNASLERRVAERTSELEAANRRLAAEIDERERAERDLQAYADEISDLYNHAPCGYHSLDDSGTFVRINDTELRWLGYRREEIVGRKKFTDLLVPSSAATFEAGFAAFKERGWVKDLDYSLARRDGTILHVLLNATAIYDDMGRFIMTRATTFDITERRRAEASIRELNVVLRRRTFQLEAANKELEAFSYSVSHDLRAPLRHVAGFTDMLARLPAVNGDPRATRMAGTIAKAAVKMGDLIDDLLLFSRTARTELRCRPVALDQLVQEVMHDLQGELAGRNIVWKIEPLPVVPADRALLRQVLANLFSNAIKYTRPRPEAVVQVQCVRQENEFVFSVRDNGVGFAAEYASRLFGVFQRLHREEEFEGTGIGLAHARRIIERHGGKTWAEGAVGQGARFHFTLPVTPVTPPEVGI